MKKGKSILPVILLAFSCIAVGFFLGRISPVGQTDVTQLSYVHDADTSAETDANAGRVANAGKININTASEAQLQMLPNIGEVLASRIVAYRTQHGPFTRIDDLILVEGIGEKRLDALREYVTLGG